MSLKLTTPIRFTALAMAITLTAVAFAQTSIRVEESTGTVSRTPAAQPINIQIGGPANEPERIKVTETTGSEESAHPGTQINLTPAEFRARRMQDLATQTPAADVQTTMPTPAPVTGVEAPSGIPVPTDLNAPPQNTDAAAEPAVEPTPEATPDSTPVAEPPADDDSASTTPIEGSILATSETAEPQSFDPDELFPPAALAKEKVLTRNGIEVPTRPESLSSAPLTITVPDVFETTLTNGLRFYHYESRDLPRVRVSLLIEAGKNEDPADKVGLAEITARTMRTGGAAGKSGDDVDRQLEQIGSDLEFNIERDHVSGSLFALTEKAPEAMALLAAIITKPDFEESKYQQQIDRAREDLRRQNDDPAEISRREFRKLIYGQDHPLARTPTSASISAITRDDVRAFHDARYRPSTVWVGVSGDISRDDARKLVEDALGDWQRPPAEPSAEITFSADADATAGVFLTRKATAQSQIRLGHSGIPRQSPQVYAVNVLNSIYGTGGFSSRLMNQVRTKHGYVYGVGGGIFSDDPVGLFTAAAASKGGTTAAAINEIISVTKDLVEGTVSQVELETGIRDIVFTFVNQFDTPSETISTHMLYDYRGYAEDYLQNFTEKIKAVTLDDVNQAAADLLHPDRLKIYVIGNETSFDQPLDQFGDVHIYELEDYTAE